MDAIPGEVSKLLCIAIRQENRGRRYTFAGLQCLVCLKFSKGEPSKMCLSRREGNRGCKFVNNRYNLIHSWRPPLLSLKS